MYVCKQIKDLSTIGSLEKSGWSSPRLPPRKSNNVSKLPKISSRPNTNMPSPMPSMTGGRFVAKTDARCLEIDVSEFDSCIEQYNVVDKEREANAGYIASFLAGLDILSTWPWLEVLDLASQIKGIQVDKGLCLFSQGDRIEGIHIIYRGEAQMEFDNAPANRPVAGRGASEEGVRGTGTSAHRQVTYGFTVDVTADSDGLPLTRVSKKRGSKSIGFTVAFMLLFSICRSGVLFPCAHGVFVFLPRLSWCHTEYEFVSDFLEEHLLCRSAESARSLGKS